MYETPPLVNVTSVPSGVASSVPVAPSMLIFGSSSDRRPPGADGQELATALGTMVRFTRGGVQYTVIGSVPPNAAEAAARAL